MKLIIVLLAPVAIFCAPQAAADINVSGINFGNQGNAQASFGNVAVAVGPLDKAEAVGGVGNFAWASGGSVASKKGSGSFNLVTAAGNSNSTVIDGNLNVSSTLNQSSSTVINSNGTINVAVGKNSSKPSTVSTVDENLRLAAAFCGGTSNASRRIDVTFGDPCRG